MNVERRTHLITDSEVAELEEFLRKNYAGTTDFRAILQRIVHDHKARLNQERDHPELKFSATPYDNTR